MAFTYTPGGSADVDRIRLEVGDTVDATTDNESLHDEEISDLVARAGNWQRAVPGACRALAMKLASQPTSHTVGQLQIVQKRVDYLLAKAEQWETSLAAGAATPTAGGSSVSQAEAWAADTDRPRSVFTRPESTR